VIIVSDTSPITSLLSVGRIEILRDLFSTVRIPAAVDAELRAYHADVPSFIEVAQVKDTARVEHLEETLDRAEAEAIVLAHELDADLLLIDEKIGREIAERDGLHVIGLLGVLVLAKKKNLVPSVSACIDELRQIAGFYVSDAVRDLIVRAAGED